MQIETPHLHPTAQQADPGTETLPMPVAGNDIGPAPALGDSAVRMEAPTKLHRTWDKVRTTVTSLPERARQARLQGAHYVAEEPVKATMMAAAGGAALAMVLRAAVRRSRH